MIKMIEKSTLEYAENLAKLEETLFTTSWDRVTINEKINPVSYTHLTLPTN